MKVSKIAARVDACGDGLALSAAEPQMQFFSWSVLHIPQMQLDLLHIALHTEIDYNQCSVCR